MSLAPCERMKSRDQQRFMRLCLQLAQRGKGTVSPNPLVGALLVKGGHVVARGYHRRFGGPHAEVECLRGFEGDISHATLFVNLEPCAHHGKTPPCTDLIIKRGIKNVVVGMEDPNPLVDGKGIRRLRNAGVTVTTGVLEDEARRLNQAFITYVTERRPLVHLKIAQTLDGKIASHEHSYTQITGKESQALVHRLRAEHDAILVGAGTVRADDPSLTVRFAKGKDPSAVVLDGRLSLGPGYRLWKTAPGRRIIILTAARAARQRAKRVREFSSQGIEVVPVNTRNNRIPIRNVMRELYRKQIASVLVEAGTDLVSQFATSGLVDMLSIFLAPKVFGSGVPAFEAGTSLKRFRISEGTLSVRAVGQDVLLQYDFSRRQ